MIINFQRFCRQCHRDRNRIYQRNLVAYKKVRSILEPNFVKFLAYAALVSSRDKLVFDTFALNIKYKKVLKVKLKCINGHAWIPSNIYSYNGGKVRNCRVCSGSRRKQAKAKKKSQRSLVEKLGKDSNFEKNSKQRPSEDTKPK